MKKLSYIFLIAMLAVLSSCHKPLPPSYHLIPHTWVYNILEHNDSLYFCTSEEGIFSFALSNENMVRKVANVRRLPFRSMLMTKENKLIASSYYGGVFTLEKDTLLPIHWAPFPAWSMRYDDKGSFWIAGTRGIYFSQGDSLVLFNRLLDAHDMCVFGDTVIIAHMKGLSFYNKTTGKLLKTFAPGVCCWSIMKYGNAFVGGGENECSVIQGDSCRVITFGPEKNILWCTVLDSSNTLFMGTQKGLYKANLMDKMAKPLPSVTCCVKILFIDSKQRLWVGRYDRMKKMTIVQRIEKMVGIKE